MFTLHYLLDQPSFTTGLRGLYRLPNTTEVSCSQQDLLTKVHPQLLLYHFKKRYVIKAVPRWHLFVLDYTSLGFLLYVLLTRVFRIRLRARRSFIFAL